MLCVLPSVDPDAESENVVNPFFWIVFVFVFTRDGFASGEAVRSVVAVSWDMNKFKVK